jgi:hypothetical protein
MCRGSLEDPRPKPSTTNTLRPSNAEQIIRDELYWFPKSAHILNIRGSNHPKRAFKDAMRTFAYAVLQTTAEFVHADNVPEEWYSDDDTDEDEESSDDNSDNSSENDQNAETDNDNDENAEVDNAENHAEADNHDNLNPRQEIHLDEAHVNRTRGVNPNLRRAASRGSDFDLRDFL